MRVDNWENFIKEKKALQKPSAITIGVFDGVHIGHQVLIEKIVKQGKNPTVITFRQNPKKSVFSIISLRQKLDIFENLGVLQTILIDFSENFSTIRGQDFIDLLIECGNMTYLAIGSDFKCGNGLDMNSLLIKETYEKKGIEVEIIPPLSDGEFTISSSRIRKAISSGDLKSVNTWLGRNFVLDMLNIPFKIEEGFDPAFYKRLIPPDGEYSVLVYETVKKEGEKIKITIKERKIIFPSTINAFSIKSIEFLTCS